MTHYVFILLTEVQSPIGAWKQPGVNSRRLQGKVGHIIHKANAAVVPQLDGLPTAGRQAPMNDPFGRGETIVEAKSRYCSTPADGALAAQREQPFGVARTVSTPESVSIQRRFLCLTRDLVDQHQEVVHARAVLLKRLAMKTTAGDGNPFTHVGAIRWARPSRCKNLRTLPTATTGKRVP